MLRARSGASILQSGCMRPLFPLRLCKKAYKLVTRRREGTFYPDEIEIQKTHTKHRKLDSQATLSHGTRGRAPDGLRTQAWSLRPSRRDHDPGRLSARPAGLRGLRPAMAAVMRCGLCVGYDAITLKRPTYSFPSAGGQISPIGFHRLIQRIGKAAKMPFPIHPHMLRHACGFKLANDGHDTRALQHYLGHKNIQHTVRYTELSADRFKDFWRG